MSEDHTYPHSGYSPSDAGAHPSDFWPWLYDNQPPEPPMPGSYPACNVDPRTNIFPPPTPAESQCVQWNDIITPNMSQSSSQDTSELSPLPFPEGVHALFPDLVTTPQSPPVPGIALTPSPMSVYYSPLTELSPRLSVDTCTSPPGSFLPVPSSLNSPYMQVSPMGSSARTYSSLGDSCSSSYQNLYAGSPSSMASHESFYSLNSPAVASTSSFGLPTSASPRGISYFLPNWEPSTPAVTVQQAPTVKRQRVPQTIKLSPKRNRSHKESFSSGGSPGVRVVDVLKGDAALDGSDERVLERTGHRQIRVTVQWPGYPEKLSKDRYIAIQDKDTRTYITRGELAKHICDYIAEYVKKAVRAPPPKSDKLWTFTSVDSSKPGITIDNLWLTSVAAASKNIWLVELEVLRY